MPTFPFRVVINLDHNHPLDALRHRDVGPEARNTITELLKSGHSASSALEVYKLDLQMEHPADYIVRAKDRYHFPDMQWCYR